MSAAPTPDVLISFDGNPTTSTGVIPNPGYTVGTVTYVPGVMGQAARLSNPNPVSTTFYYYTDVPQLTPATTGQSMACWVNFATIHNADQFFLVWGQSYFFLDNTGKWATNIRKPDVTFPSIYAGYGPTVGQWYHAASVFDNTTGRLNLYINGSLVVSGPPVTAANGFSGVALAGPDSWSNRSGDISIDDIRLFTTALTAAQVLAIYQIPYFINAPTGSLLNRLGFVDQQPISASTAAQNSYVFPFDDYVNVWIENIGTSSQEPQQITYKIPVQPGTTYWTNNNVNNQVVNNQNSDFPFSRMNISVRDRFGNLLDNNGQDWSFTIKVPDLIHIDTSAPYVTKINGNPFQLSITLPVFYKNVTRVELVSAEIPWRFYNICSPFNTFVINGNMYTVPSGIYTTSSLLTTMNSLISSALLVFSALNNRIYLSTGVGYLKGLSSAAKASLSGAYSFLPLFSSPVKVLNIISNGNTIDVYSDIGKNLTVTGGASLSDWLKGSIGYINTWYDQSGNGRDATGVSGYGSQPFVDAVNKCVDATLSGYFYLPIGTVPHTGNYTVIVKHGPTTDPSAGVWGGGLPGDKTTNSLRLNFNGIKYGYDAFWYNFDYIFDSYPAISSVNGNIVSIKYASPTIYGYINGTTPTTNPYETKTGWNYTDGPHEYLCASARGDQKLKCKMYSCFMFTTALSDADRILVESVTS